MTKKFIVVEVRATDYEGSFSEWKITVDIENEMVKDVEQADYYGYGPSLYVNRYCSVEYE